MTWRVAKSLEKLRAQINILAPDRSKASDGTIGDAAHTSRSSDHNPWVQDGSTGVVTALDITHDPKNGVDCQKIADALVKAKDSRIKYIIWNHKIISSETSPWVWRKYSGSNPHTRHIHISVKSSKGLYDSEKEWAFAPLPAKTTKKEVKEIINSPVDTGKVNIILFRGLAGTYYSAGLDVLAEDLRRLKNVDYVVVLPYTAADSAARMIERFRDDTVLIGHSFGVGAFLNVAKGTSRVIPLAVSFDPSQYWGGGHTIPSNLKRVINFWQDTPRWMFWKIGNQEISGAENVHVDATHTNIEDRRDLHLKVLDEVSKLK